MPLGVNELGRATGADGKVTTHADLLIYGDSKAGKTYRAATAPGPLYVITADRTGHKAIPFTVKGLVAKTVKDIRDDLTELQAGGHGYKTVLLDGLSFLHTLYLREIGQYFVERMGAKDADLLPIQARMKILARFQQLLQDFIDLTQLDNEKDRVHVVMTTLAERLKEDENAPFHIRPMIGTNRMNQDFPALFSIVSYIYPLGEVREGELSQQRYMYFSQHKGALAGDRLGIFPPAGEAPNLSEYLA